MRAKVAACAKDEGEMRRALGDAHDDDSAAGIAGFLQDATGEVLGALRLAVARGHSATAPALARAALAALGDGAVTDEAASGRSLSGVAAGFSRPPISEGEARQRLMNAVAWSEAAVDLVDAGRPLLGEVLARRAAMNTFDLLSEHPAAAQALTGLAALYERRNKPGLAIASRRRAIAMENALLLRELVVGTDEQRRQVLRTTTSSTAALVQLALDHPSLPSGRDAVLDVLLDRKGRRRPWRRRWAGAT